MQHLFETPAPTTVYVEIGSGDVDARAEDTDRTVIDVEGEYADEVIVEQRGDQIVVLGPHRKQGFFGNRNQLRVRISLPTDSELATKLGSADVSATGRLGTAKIRTGSGDVRLDEIGEEALIETGSGDIQLGSIAGELRIKSGSGDIETGHLGGPASIATGSGDVQITTADDAVQVRSGSGDLRIRDAQNGVELSTASGDLYVDRAHRGRVTAKNASGDINVGIPDGTPVWTDINTVTGSVSTNLASAGEPAPGQDYVELRAKTVSGDIHLEQR